MNLRRFIENMEVSLKDLKPALQETWQNHFVARVTQPLYQQHQFTQKLSESISEYLQKSTQGNNQLEDVENILHYKDQVASSLHTLYNSLGLQTPDFDHTFAIYIQKTQEVYSQLPKVIVATQLAERFRILKKDGWGSRFVKLFKIPAYYISKGLFRLKHLFSKHPPQYPFWRHRIPIRRMIRYYFFDELAKKTSQYTERAHEKVYATTEQLHQLAKVVDFCLHKQCFQEWDEQVDWEAYLQEFEAVANSLQTLIDFLEREMQQAFQQVFDTFSEAVEKVDTLELQRGYFTPTSLTFKRQKTNELYTEINRGWYNRLFVLFEDWRFDHELFTFRYRVAQIRINTTTLFEEKITQKILPLIGELCAFLSAHQQRLKRYTPKDADYLDNLTTEKKRIKEEFNEHIIEEIRTHIHQQQLPTLVDQVETKFKTLLGKLTERKTLVEHGDYDQALTKEDVISIIPHELVAFELLPHFLQANEAMKEEVGRKLLKTDQTLVDVSQIAYFNIDSIIEIAQNDLEQATELKEIIQKGIERDVHKINELRDQLQETVPLFTEKLQTSVRTFSQGIIALTEHIEVLEVRKRIQQMKAREASQRFQNKIGNFFIYFIPNAAKTLISIFQQFQAGYQQLRERYGPMDVTPPQDKYKTVELVTQTQAALDKLPYVYQRLFRINTLETKALFKGREKEISQLSKAYEYWLNGRFAPTILFAEKGSGLTSLINFFIQRVKPQYRLIRMDEVPKIQHPQDFINFFVQHLPTKASIETFDDLIQYFVKLPRKHIVILENLENFYLRSIDGFNCMKMYVELLAKTNKNVFWITTCSTYAWDYLNKSHHFANYFGYLIPLRKLNHTELEEIILYRHEMSGFDVRFELSEKDLENKKFKKMSGEEKQASLKKVYFKQLGKFVEGNISLAFSFWLRSTKKVVNNTISVSFLADTYLSLPKQISNEKIFALHMLLLHDGLSEEHMAQVSRKDVAESRLLLMLLVEEGLVLLSEGIYTINPLFYRQVVHLLTEKNIIH